MISHEQAAEGAPSSARSKARSGKHPIITIDVLTLSPGMFLSPLSEGMMQRGIQKGLVRVRVFNLRDFTGDRHRTVDDRPYGGGSGMVLKPEPIGRALNWLKSLPDPRPRTILFSPQGRLLGQPLVRELAGLRRLILLCGRYEGVDERVSQLFCDDLISIGDYVLSGGELPALVLMDTVIRLIPGVLGSIESDKEETFEDNLLEYPHYTRPPEYMGHKVPEVLLSGDHRRIRAWRRRQSLARTLKHRPNLIGKDGLSPEDEKIIKELKKIER